MMSAQRREGIHQYLIQAKGPVTATALAKLFNVSRQVIVGDIALMRAANMRILATPRGYLADQDRKSAALIRTIACRHTLADMAEELNTIVDHGAGILDVIVEHPVYGQITGQLQIFSRFDAESFVHKIRERQAPPLSVLTDGVHFHTIACPSEAVYERILNDLGEKGYLLLEQRQVGP